MVRVQLKDSNFKNYTHQVKLENATNNNGIVFETARKLLNEMWKDDPIRLVGLALDDLTNEFSYQVSLFDKEDDISQNKELDEAVDKLKDKFGFDVINKASLVGKKRVRKKY